MQLLTNGLGAVVRDARNEDKNAMKSGLVVDGVKQLMQNAFMKLSYGGVEEHLTNLDLEHVFLMLKCPRIR